MKDKQSDAMRECRELIKAMLECKKQASIAENEAIKKFWSEYKVLNMGKV